MNTLLQPIESLVSLFFPNICLACGSHLHQKEEVICLACQHFLPQTHFHKDPENPVFRIFWGRVPIQFATSYYYFKKGSKVQNLLHYLKYKHRPEVGEKIGQLYGQELRETAHFADIDLVVPVPLHPHKLKIRGFNQSAAFAEGLAESLEIEWSDDILIRTEHTASQTNKRRFERWQNVARKFSLNQTHSIEGKHVLLVDDVVTTGSTLESCSHALLQARSTKVSIATIAYATQQ